MVRGNDARKVRVKFIICLSVFVVGDFKGGVELVEPIVVVVRRVKLHC